MKKRKLVTIVIYVAILALVFSWMLGLFGGGGNDITYSQMMTLFRQEQVKRFVVEGERMKLWRPAMTA